MLAGLFAFALVALVILGVETMLLRDRVKQLTSEKRAGDAELVTLRARNGAELRELDWWRHAVATQFVPGEGPTVGENTQGCLFYRRRFLTRGTA